MSTLVVLAAVLSLAVIGSAEQCGQMECPECKNEPTPTDCDSGCLTKDRCGCCLVCAKAEGKKCGGYNYNKGYCADGLYCDRANEILIGTCKKCMPACTIDYCSGSDDKNKICSATGAMMGASSTRGCQHTTCGSCFLVSDPSPACQRCDPHNQTKENGFNKCLKHYHACLRRHYRSAIENLTAVTNNTAGFVFCREALVV